MKKKSLTNYCVFIIIMIFSFSFISKLIENDLFFDIKTGQTLLKFGVDFKDHFSFIPDLIYIYHHYLYNLLIYFIYNFFGYNGVFIFFYLCFSVFGLLIFYVNNKQSSNKVSSLFITLFTMYICCYAFQSRVQSLTYCLFYLEVYFINMLYDTGQRQYSLYLILLGILIANLHMPLWIFSIILFLPYIFQLYFKKSIDKFKKINSIISNKLIIEYPKNQKTFIFTFIVILLTGFLTPLRLYPYTFFTKSLFNNDYLFIYEMKTTALLYYKWEIILILIFIVGSYTKYFKVKLYDLSLFLGLFIFSLICRRNVIYFYIFVPTIIFRTVCFSKKKIDFEIITKLKEMFYKVNSKVVLIFSSISLTMISIFCIIDMDFKNYNYGIDDRFPVKSVEYIKENLDYKNIRLYNQFNYGSYLEFNDIPVFVDSRAEVYLEEFNGGKDIIGDYLDAFDYDKYKDIFDKYQFDYALVYRDNELYYYLENDDDFQVIFEEDYYILYEKIIN